MTSLESSFEADLREALLEDIEQTLREEVGPQLKQAARENFEAYASAHGYDIEHIWQDAEGPMIDRDGDSVSLRIEWPGLTALFEFGVSPHTIEGDPILSFVWEGPPGGTRPPGAPKHVVAQEVNWGSVTGGIPESRAIRDAMNTVRRELQA